MLLLTGKGGKERTKKWSRYKNAGREKLEWRLTWWDGGKKRRGTTDIIKKTVEEKLEGVQEWKDGEKREKKWEREEEETEILYDSATGRKNTFRITEKMEGVWERGRKKEKKWGRKTKMLGEKMDGVPKKERAKRTTEKKGRRQKLWMKQGKTNYEGKIKRQERETEGKEKRKEWKEWPPFLSPRHPLTLRPPYFPPRPFFSLPPPSALSTFISETFDTRMTPLPLALLKVKFNASSQTQKRRRRSVFCSHRGRVSQFNQKEGFKKW